jgi:hypothetical protein
MSMMIPTTFPAQRTALCCPSSLAPSSAMMQGALVQSQLSVVILLAVPVLASAPVVDTQSHEEDRSTDTPTEQKDEYKNLAAGHISHPLSILLCVFLS